VSATSTPEPYVGPRPFDREDYARFFGRFREADDLLSLVLAHPVVLIYAASGAGKSSLLNAGLIPRLAEEEFQILGPARVTGPVPPGTGEITNIYRFHALTQWNSDLSPSIATASELASLSLADFLQRLDEREPGRPRALLFDQFEEFFTANVAQSEQRRAFIEELAQALRAASRLKVVFAMREEYVTQFEPFAHSLPDKLRTRMRLEPLRARAAVEAIRKPLEALDLSFEERADNPAEALVGELLKIHVDAGPGQAREITGEFVDPLQLQVVCQNMWRNFPPEVKAYAAERQTLPREVKRPVKIISPDQIRIGDVDQALAEHYNHAITEAVQASGASEGQLRRWFDSSLITAGGVRGIALSASEETAALPETALAVFLDQRLVRMEARGASTWYEMTHDRFIEPIRRSNGLWFEQWAVSEALRRKLEAKAQTAGAFLEESETREAEAFLASPDAGMLGTSPEVASLVRASRLHVDEEKARKARELEDAHKLAESEHARAEVRSRLARRAFLFALAACVASALSLYLWQRASRMQQQAEIQGLASYLTAEAFKHQKDQLDLSLLLSIEAYRVAGTMNPSTKKLQLMKSRLRADAKSSLLAGLVSSSHLLRFAHDQGDAIRSIVSTKDGRLTITGSKGGTVIGWNSSGNPVTQPLQRHTNAVVDLALSPDGSTLASASADGKILLWNVAAMQKKPLRLNAKGDRVDASVFGIDFSPDGKSIVSASSTGAITLWDVAARKRIDSVPGGHGKSAYRAIFNPAGDRIASCGANDVVNLWKVDSGKLVLVKKLVGHLTEDKARRFVGHPEGSEIFDLAFSPDGSILVSAGWEGTVVRWRLTESEPAAEPLHDEKSQTAHRRAVYAVAFSSDGKIVASGSADQTIRFWNAETGETINTDFAGYAQTIYCLGFRPERGNPTGILLAGTATGAFTMWEPTQEESILSSQVGVADWVTRVRFDPGGHKIASCVEKKGAIFLTDLTTFVSEELKGHSKQVRSFAFSPDGRTYAAGAEDGKLLLWDSAPGAGPNSLNAIPSLPWDSAPSAAPSSLDAIPSQPISQPIYVLPILEPIYGLAYTPDSKILVSGGPADQILVWDVSSRKLLRRLERNGSKLVLALALSPDGKTLAVASGDSKVALWNVTDWQLRPKTLDHEGVSLGLAFSPDSKTLAASAAKEIILWDVASATRLGPPLRKHDDTVNAVAFSPNGEILASGSEDRSIILWNVATRQLLAVLPAKYSAHMRDVAFSPDGRILAAAGWDTTLWNMNFDFWQCRAAEMAGRNLTREEWSNYFQDEPYRPTFPYGLMVEAHRHAVRGEADEARRGYAEAVKTAAKTKDMSLNNEIAWIGTVDGFANVVLPACDVAIREASPWEKPLALDTRGVAHACTGKLREAAADLQEFVDWVKTMRPDWEKRGKQREVWVAELRAGRNPIDKKTLEALRIED